MSERPGGCGLDGKLQLLRDRCSMIASVFVQAYFGHVSHHTAVWSELEVYCENYLAAAENVNANVRNSNKVKDRANGNGGYDADADAMASRQSTMLQDALADVIDNHSLNAFPVSRKQRRSTLKWIVDLCTKHKLALAPSTAKLCNVIGLDEVGDEEVEEAEYIFKTFERAAATPTYVTLLEENRNLIGHGTTGLTSWQGAMFLADWADNNGHLLKGKRILELGSGAGLFGVSLLKTQDVREYTFTDCHYRVLNFLIYNLEQNFPPRDAEGGGEVRERRVRHTETGPPIRIREERVKAVQYHRRNTSSADADANEEVNPGADVVIRHLDWREFDAGQYPVVDVVVGSDIVYERTLLPDLCCVLWGLLGGGGGGDGDGGDDDDDDESWDGAVAYLACTERSYTTLDCFHEQLGKHRLKYTVINKGLYSPSESILSSDVQHQPIRLYKIQREEAALTDHA